MPDPYRLARFVEAQSAVYRQVLDELQAGQKRTHWMWFVFPQIAGLGQSETARHFALSDRAAASAYLAHPLLGPRLVECTTIVNTLAGNRTAHHIFSTPDDLKFRSCMTLFNDAAGDPEPFRTALGRYFDGKPDQWTLDLLAATGTAP